MDRETYVNALLEMYLRPPGDDHPEQKFPKGSRVKVADEMPWYMTHFPSGFEAIVEYSYAQKYGTDNVRDYSLIVLSDGRPINSIAWYKDFQLTLLDSNIDANLKLIERYREERATEGRAR